MGKKINLLEQASRYLVLGTKCRSINLKLYRDLTGLDPLALYHKQIEELVEEGLITIKDDVLFVTDKGCTYILDIGCRFQTENNLKHTQPQYEVLDMFEGMKKSFDELVIEKEDE